MLYFYVLKTEKPIKTLQDIESGKVKAKIVPFAVEEELIRDRRDVLEHFLEEAFSKLIEETEKNE